MSGGAFGVLIVTDATSSGTYPGLTGAAAVASSSQLTALKSFLSDVTVERTVMCGKTGGVTLCNGASTAAVVVPKSQWTRVRIAVCEPTSSSYVLSLGCAVGAGASCTVDCIAQQIARDGVYLSSVPSASATSWPLSNIGRIDLAISCSGPASLVWNGGTIAVSVSGAGSGSGSSSAAASPFVDSVAAAWAPTRPYYLNDLRSAVVDDAHNHTLQVSSATVKWRQGTTGALVSLAWNGTSPAGSLEYNTIYEVIVLGSHPFNMHTYPLQVCASAPRAYTVFIYVHGHVAVAQSFPLACCMGFFLLLLATIAMLFGRLCCILLRFPGCFGVRWVHERRVLRHYRPRHGVVVCRSRAHHRLRRSCGCAVSELPAPRRWRYGVDGHDRRPELGGADKTAGVVVQLLVAAALGDGVAVAVINGVAVSIAVGQSDRATSAGFAVMECVQ